MNSATAPISAALVLASTVAVIAQFPADARAQAMDYGGLEQLFGEPVTTSATGSPQRATEVPASMEIVTAGEIRRSGAIDIPGTLRHVGGVDVLQWASNNADVSVRGYDQAYSPRLLVLVDGRQVYADHYGFTPWSTLPVELNAIRQIELVKGPNSALFGFNAVGGVINIVTYDPALDSVNSVSLTGGTQNMAQLSAVATFKLGSSSGLRVSLGGRRNDEFNTPVPIEATGADRPGNDRKAVTLDGSFGLSDEVQVRVEASHSEVRQNAINPIYVYQFQRYRTDSLRARLTADTGIGLIQAGAYTNWLILDAYPLLVNSSLHFDNRVTVAQVQDIVKLGADHTLRGTIEYRHNSEGSTPAAGAEVFYDVVSGGGMWEWRMAPTLTLTNAVRVDHLALGRRGFTPPGLSNQDWDRTINELSFNSGAVWRVNPTNILRATISRGVQVPHLNESGALLILTPAFSSTGIATLAPTIVRNVEIDWDHALPGLGAELRMSAFKQDTTDISAVQGGFMVSRGVPYGTPITIGSSHAYGLEIGLTGQFREDWNWSLSYRVEKVRDDFIPLARGGLDLVDFQHTTPRSLVNASIGWHHGRWEADLYGRYQSKMAGLLAAPNLRSTLTPVDGYLSLDGRLAYRLSDQVTLALSGQNIGQATQRQTSGPRIERRLLGSISFSY